MRRLENGLTFALLASTALAGIGPVAAVELPRGPSVVSGGVAVTQPSANSLAIQQSTGTAILNWQSFSVGQGGAVNITQPSASSALLNRVTGQTPSTIAGQINANGQVYLVNPNGIVITKTGTVNAGAFVASSLGISDDDFRAGRRNFIGNGASAAVVNEGTITIGSGGYAALLGGRVENSGTISVPLGKVGLGSGEDIRLDLSGDGFLQVAVPSAGQPGNKALIDNSGTIRARGGLVEIKAATARDAARNVINVSGVIEARSVSGRNGAIVLGGGDGGSVTVSGRLDVSGGRRQAARATAPAKGYARGGSITVTGDDIRLSGATLDASGAGGGGSIRVGGDYQGGGGLQRASYTSVDAGTTIRADALKTGDGGRVILWSDKLTTFDGLITARGGPDGGNGGFAEVSGKARLAYSGYTDLTAPRGAFGNLLLDPFDVTISNNGDSNQSGFVATGNNSNINVGTLVAALQGANVTVTTGAGGAQSGNITVQDAVNWSAATTLTLNAANSIVVGGGITNTGNGALTLIAQGNISIVAPISFGGTLVIQAGNTTGAGALPVVGSVSASQSINVGGFALDRGNFVQIGNLPAFNAGVFKTNGDGTASSPASFLRASGGSGSAGDPYLIGDIYGLQGIGSSFSLLGNSYALTQDISASGTTNWNSGAGFKPIGDATNNFRGNFDGRDHAVTDLFINLPNATNVGLFGLAAGSTIQHVRIENANVTGNLAVGALIGQILNNGATGPTVRTARSSGTVKGQDGVGGLIGAVSGNGGTAQLVELGSSATVDVGGGASLLTGSNSLGQGSAGGLIGIIFATGGTFQIDQSFASGPVTGRLAAGGLIGAIGDGQVQFGGAAVAAGPITISNSYALGQVQAQSGVAGGLIGSITTNSGISPANVNVQSSYAAGRVVTDGGVTTGGLIASLGGNGNVAVSNSYWDTQSTGRTSSAGGGQGLTTAQLKAGLPGGFDPGIWGSFNTVSYPYLNWRFPAGVLVVSGTTRSADAITPGAASPGELLALAANGVVRDQIRSAADGSYYFQLDPGPGSVTVFRNAGTRGFSSADVSQNAVTGLDVTAGGLIRTNQGATSGIAATLASIGDSTLSANIPYTVGAGGPITFLSGLQIAIDARNAAGLTVDRSISAPGGLAITGVIPQITPATIAAGLTIGRVAQLTIAPGQFLRSTGGAVLINTQRFTNNGGPAAIQAPAFQVYSVDYDQDTRGGLSGSNLYNRSLNPLSIPQVQGGLFVFSRQPLLTVTALNATRGSNDLGSLTFTQSISGLVNGDSAAQAFSGQPSFTDTLPAGVGGGVFPGALRVGQGSLASQIGYGFVFQDAPITISGVSPAQIAATQPTLSRQLAGVVVPLPQNQTTIDIGFNLGGGGPSLGVGVAGGSASGANTRAGAQETLNFVQGSARELERELERCERSSSGGREAYTGCVGGALDQFANRLDTRILSLPAPLRNVAAVIREAARGVRAAPSVAAARAVVRTAVAEVRKAIALIRADDPAVTRLQKRQGNVIASALQSVDTKLARAVGL